MNVRWAWRMAWRDSRGSRQRLLLAAAAITFGLAALVAISSFGDNVREAVRNQAKILLGADLVFSSRQPFGPETQKEISLIGGEQAHEVRCNSMAYFPKSAGTRLVQIRALEGAFPYYGALETEPPTAAQSFLSGPYALVDDSLLYQFNVQVGDSIQLGAFAFTVAGRLKKIPGEAGAASLIGPRVYIPMTYVPQTTLIQQGSMVTYRTYFKLPKATDPDRLVETLRPHFNKYRIEADTVQKRAASIGRVMDNMSRFLNLTGFIALLLGGIGVASAIHVYIKEKMMTVALLRCLGARMTLTFAVYLVQAAVLGLGGALSGAILGVAIQQVLPTLLKDFLPVHIDTAVSMNAIAQSLTVGSGIVLLFSLLPLLAVRHVSPLQVLRSAYDTQRRPQRDPLQWVVVALIILGTLTFALSHAERWAHGFIFCAVLGAALLFLIASTTLLMSFAQSSISPAWPYVWRQGLANLHRPHNQTHILVLALGLGAFLLMTLQFVQHALIQQVSRNSNAEQANLILFDIQTDQREGVSTLVRSFSLPPSQEAPLVTMRLAAIKGKTVEELRDDKTQEISDWALQHEYRATYRDHLIDTETLIAGKWQGRHHPSDSTPMISLEDEVARALHAKVGDALTFDIQGVPFTVIVASIRKVDWQQIKPNFFVVFPAGVLEAAPQTYLLVTRTPTNEISAALQQAVVQQFPNVSAIDLTSVLHTLDTILQRVTFALRFMTLFTIAAGLFVLMNAVLTSRGQRRKESILLRTLGASRRQIQQILFTEYVILGSLAALSGASLAILASWALSQWLFEATFAPTLTPIILAWILVSGLTVLTGLWGNRGVTTQSPLEVLRSEN